MSSSLPFTVQDDLEAREKYAAQQRSNSRFCGSRSIRLWSIVLVLLFATVYIINYVAPTDYFYNKDMFISDHDDIIPSKENVKDIVQENTTVEKEPLTLKDEILGLIHSHQLIVFSKTYCPYSKKAKTILNSYNLKEPLKVVEVNLRDDDYQVKLTLDEISGRATFPNIFLNSESIGGSDDLEDLHNSGQLLRLLKDNQLLLG